MLEERKTIEARLSASPEVYRHTKFMARFEKAFPWLLVGGAVLGLLETYRKNANDRAKSNADIKAALKNQEHQTEVLKERKAERRERYTKAVEQLGNEKAPVRMGGVYTLIGLADEWLLDENLDYAEKVREGQVIVNNLCAYIRSPFTLTSYYDELSEDAPSLEGSYKDKKEKFYADKAILDSEADVRLSIIKEIHDRLQGPKENTPGTWSDFEYDFSGSVFFYPVDLTKSYYKKPINFSGSTYEDEADFRHSTYQGEANFSRSTYQGWAYFRHSTYQGGAYFRHSTYQGWADFSGSTYQDKVRFSHSTYRGRADFGNSIYLEEADLRRSTYQDEADFSGSVFYREIYFGYSTYSPSFSRLTGCAPQFYDETNRKNTLFGSPDNDFSVENGRGYPVYRSLDGLPLGCAFLTTEQKEYLADKFQEIEKIQNKLLEVKDPKEKAELSKNLQALTEKLHEWREEATTVKVEGTALGEEDN